MFSFRYRARHARPRRHLLHLVWRLVQTGFIAGVALLAVLAAVGIWYSPGIVRREALVPAQSTTTTTTPPIDLGSTPAAAILSSLLAALPPGVSAAPATQTTPPDPLLLACSATVPITPALVASQIVQTPSGAVVLDLSAYGAGLGARARYLTHQALSSCGYDYALTDLSLPPPVSGYSASGTYSSTTYHAVIMGASDVSVELFSAAASPTDMATLTGSLASSLSASILSSCANPQAPPSDFRRNPSQSGYTGLLQSQPVSPPASATPPDPSLLDAPTPVVPTPPLGAVTALPSPPITPVVPALTATIWVPQTDTVGPGCGWSFTGQQAPSAPVVDVAALTSGAVSRLEAQWSAWPAQVTSYLNARAQYQADLLSYQSWVASTTTTTTTTSSTSTTTTSTTTTSTTSTTTTTVPAGSPSTTTTAPALAPVMPARPRSLITVQHRQTTAPRRANGTKD